MLLPFDLDERRRNTAPGTSLGGIADALGRELAPWVNTRLPIPDTKARLTRLGGRCAKHGTLLAFDPASPWAHVCEQCGQAYTDREHHEWWAMNAHLFTAERTVHAAVLYLLRGHGAHRELAVSTLRAIAGQYARWQNRDNVLGPSRPFFSTYLEAIWLLNLCHALSLLEMAGVTDVSELLRERVLLPSSELVASYHEGRSNRQVWNEVAVLSAWVMLRQHLPVTLRIEQHHSIPWLLREGLLDDGTWYEGENYHQFAHRGLWYGVQLLDAMGHPIDDTLRRRFSAGFATPFAGMLPDETLPSRRDSQYAVSVRQWRWAEWCELGYAFAPDQRLAGVLGRLYDGSAPVGPTGRAVSTADAERNRSPVALSRADCGWRALLMASAEPVPSARWSPWSIVQPHQGLAVIRRDGGRVYVALEGGEAGGGHGHPDRLALTVQRGAERWLDDPGTGSYVERTLHWYRSTLAHHAPLVNGASQQGGHTTLTAFEDRGGAGWVQKRTERLAPNVQATRTVVVCDGYLVDVLEWESPTDVTITLPVAHGDLGDDSEWRAATRAGAGGLEDGFDFLSSVEEWEAPEQPARMVRLAPAHSVACAIAGAGAAVASPPLQAWYDAGPHACWWRAVVPGAPAHPEQRRTFVDVTAARGRIVGMWSWGAVTNVQLDVTAAVLATVTTADGTVASHEFADHGWHIGLTARHSRSSIDLERLPAETRAPEWHETQAALSDPLTVTIGTRVIDLCDGRVHEATLEAPHYRPTEEPYGANNEPQARVRLEATDDYLDVHVHVITGHPPVVPPGGDAHSMPANPLDNERADVNADGLQCYLGQEGDAPGRWRAAVLAVPLGPHAARVTSLVTDGPIPTVHVDVADDGWRMSLRWARADLPTAAITFDLLVNERPAYRERRRGQLVFGGTGEFAYLRGDRHAPVTPYLLRLGPR